MQDRLLTKEEFLEKLKIDREFNSRYGRKHITEGKMVLPPCHYGFQVYTRELSFDERIKYANSLPLRDKWGRPVILAGFPEEAYQLNKVFNVPTRAISLMWNQRSVDTFLGLPFNIASYGLLLEIIAKEVNMVPDELIGNLGDVHLYSNHIEQAKEQIGKLTWEERKEFLTKDQFKDFGDITPFTDKVIHYWLDCNNIPYSKRQPFNLPTLKLGRFGNIIENIQVADCSDFELENYQSHPPIKAPLSN